MHNALLYSSYTHNIMIITLNSDIPILDEYARIVIIIIIIMHRASAIENEKKNQRGREEITCIQYT